MTAAKRRLFGAAALAGVAAVVARKIGPKLHEHCQEICGHCCGQTSGRPESPCGRHHEEEVRHAV
jgi:hypothetical protein